MSKKSKGNWSEPKVNYDLSEIIYFDPKAKTDEKDELRVCKVCHFDSTYENLTFIDDDWYCDKCIVKSRTPPSTSLSQFSTQYCNIERTTSPIINNNHNFNHTNACQQLQQPQSIANNHSSHHQPHNQPLVKKNDNENQRDERKDKMSLSYILN